VKQKEGGFVQTCILSVSVRVGQILGFRLIKLVTSKQLADWRTHKVWHFWTDLLSGFLWSRSRMWCIHIYPPSIFILHDRSGRLESGLNWHILCHTLSPHPFLSFCTKCFNSEHPTHSQTDGPTHHVKVHFKSVSFS
jgi:hypothetical protein